MAGGEHSLGASHYGSIDEFPVDDHPATTLRLSRPKRVDHPSRPHNTLASWGKGVVHRFDLLWVKD
jgi:hypothetical protein